MTVDDREQCIKLKTYAFRDGARNYKSGKEMMKKIKINLKNQRGTDREREKGKNIEYNLLESEMLRKKHNISRSM